MIISMLQHKGGTGKTTSTANIGACLAMKGYKVLLIDTDAQAHLSEYFLSNEKHPEYFSGDDPAGTIIDIGKKVPLVPYVARENLHIIPASLSLADLEVQLVNRIGREQYLKRGIEKLKDNYDYVLIDCSPHIGVLTLNALVAADSLLIPVQPEFLSQKGLKTLQGIIEEVSTLNENIKILGVFFTLYNSNLNIHKAVSEKVSEFFKPHIFETKIRRNVALSESPAFTQTIFEYRPNSPGAEDYNALTDEILAKLALNKAK